LPSNQMNLAFSTMNRTSEKLAENYYLFEARLSNGIPVVFVALPNLFPISWQ
jgi:hypothetical protein